jgi:hypothetical protein
MPMPFIKFDKGSVVFDTGSLAWRIAFSIVVVLLAAPAIYRSYGIFRADRIIRSEQTVESFSRALQYDPANAELWWKRGRLRHYSVQAIDIDQAASDYQRALSLNPRLGQAWVDLADCYERMGKFGEAESALEKAFATRTYSPLIRWQAGNYFLRRGNLPRMYECFKIASQYDIEKLGIAIDLSWKIDSDHEGILQKLIPDSLPSNMLYLDFLAGRDELDLAGKVWRRCLENDIPNGFEFKPPSAFGYINRLLSRNRISEASQVWNDVLWKAGTGLSDTRMKEGAPSGQKSEAQNLVWNGSFENELLRGGFDWRYPEIPEVQFQIDIGNRMDGLKSLRVTFAGANVSSGYLYQIVPIPKPGPYRLDFYLRTEGLTTDQTPYISIKGFPDADGAAGRSSLFPSTTPWSKISVPFLPKEGCRAIQLSLERSVSSKFDNKIKGSLWLDGVTIFWPQRPGL